MGRWVGQLVHFSSTIMEGRKGRYDHLNFPFEEIGVERRPLICHNPMSHSELEPRHPICIVQSLQQVTPINTQVTVLLKLIKSMTLTAVGKRTLVLGMAACSSSKIDPICLLTGFIKFWRHKKKCVSSWRYWDILEWLSLTLPGHQSYVFQKPWRSTFHLFTLKELCLALDNVFQCQWRAWLWDEWWYLSCICKGWI